MAIESISNGEVGSTCRAKINSSFSILNDLVGAIVAYGGSSAPSKWLLCDGSAISRSTYADLFAVTSTAFGVGDGSETFNLPDLRGRIPVGLNGTSFATIGSTVGSETHTLTESELPIVGGHSHAGALHNHEQINHEPVGAMLGSDFDAVTHNPATPTIPTSDAGDDITGSDGGFGGGEAHNNIQPSLVVNYIIYAGV
jgi:microcystin-dependent protein